MIPLVFLLFLDPFLKISERSPEGIPQAEEELEEFARIKFAGEATGINLVSILFKCETIGSKVFDLRLTVPLDRGKV